MKGSAERLWSPTARGISQLKRSPLNQAICRTSRSIDSGSCAYVSYKLFNWEQPSRQVSSKQRPLMSCFLWSLKISRNRQKDFIPEAYTHGRSVFHALKGTINFLTLHLPFSHPQFVTMLSAMFATGSLTEIASIRRRLSHCRRWIRVQEGQYFGIKVQKVQKMHQIGEKISQYVRKFLTTGNQGNRAQQLAKEA